MEMDKRTPLDSLQKVELAHLPGTTVIIGDMITAIPLLFFKAG